MRQLLCKMRLSVFQIVAPVSLNETPPCFILQMLPVNNFDHLLSFDPYGIRELPQDNPSLIYILIRAPADYLLEECTFMFT